MSDPVTNIEIEDVLSSIRRLVSDGDKARTRDPAPEDVTDEPADATPAEPPHADSDSKDEGANTSDRLVLTPAFLVSSDEPAPQDHAEHESDPEPDDGDRAQADDEADDTWQEEDWPEPEQAEANNASDFDEPYELTDLVWESVEDAKRIEAAKQEAAAKTVETPDLQTPVAATDRSGLVATIAELEAAISSDSDDYEPDGSEVADEVIAWPHAARHSDAETTEQAADTAEDFNLAEADDMLAFAHHTANEPAQVEPDTAAEVDLSAGDDVAEHADDVASLDDDLDGDLDGLLEAGGVTLDEEALRAMITEVVREELMGPMGERITRNVRRLVRREIYRILSSQEFD